MNEQKILNDAENMAKIAKASEYADDISADLATRSCCGISHTPERSGEAHRQDYARTIAGDYAAMQKEAVKGGTTELLDGEFQHYRAGYAKRYRAWLESKSRCISSFIAGPSGFPVARAQKRSAIADRRMEELITYRLNALKAIKRALRPDLRPIMSGDDNAVARLTAEIERAESAHETMKAANAAIRKHAKAGHDAQKAALVALGFAELAAAKLLVPDFCGRIGFSDYSLSNSTANIRRMRARLEQISAAKATPDTEVIGDGVRVEDAPADNRVRLFFDAKPDEATRARLKSNGFRWAPSVGAWQAYRNQRSLAFAKSFALKPIDTQS